MVSVSINLLRGSKIKSERGSEKERKERTSSRWASQLFQLASNISNTPLAPNPARTILFLLLKSTLPSPSNSSNRTGGGGFLGVILTTELSTFGAGRKLDLPTFRICSTFAKSWTLAERRDQSSEPGVAQRRRANSRWNIRTHVRGRGRVERSLNTSGEEIFLREEGERGRGQSKGIFEESSSSFRPPSLSHSHEEALEREKEWEGEGAYLVGSVGDTHVKVRQVGLDEIPNHDLQLPLLRP